MIEIIRTTTDDKRFKNLIIELNQDLISRYSHADYQFDINIQVVALPTAVIAQISNITVGCGCFKEISDDVVELKRMYVNPYFRGFGVASLMIDALSRWATELFYKEAVLETGIKQPEAIKLYEKHGFKVIPAFPPYIGIPNSICMGKPL
jgi:GNAT superfamily N-acetyltransferase